MNFPFPVNTIYTAITLGYRNLNYIADRVLPRVGVANRDFGYMTVNSVDRFQFPPTLVGRKGEPNEVETSATRATSSVDDHGLDDVVPQADIDSARGTNFNPMAAAVALVTGLILLAREKRVADIVNTAAPYASTNKITLASNDQWSVTHADSDPYADIQTAIAAIRGGENLYGVTSKAVFNVLKVHAKVVGSLAPFVPSDAQRSTNLSAQQVAEHFNLKGLLIGDSLINTAQMGQTEVLAPVWGKFFAVLNINPVESLLGDNSTFGATAEFGSRVAGTIPEPRKGLRGSTRVRAGESLKELVIDYSQGYLISGAIA
jgi:hypothetical protein